MGWFPFRKKTDSTDYEKVLAELDASIHKAEVRLSEIKIRERRAGALWILYSTIIWTCFLLYGILTLHGHERDTRSTLLTLAPIVIIPFGIYFAKRALTWFYARKRNYEESNLNSLRAKQKLTVEELKNKTAYYSTKSLLERYDVGAKKQEPDNQQLRQRKLASAPPSVHGPPMRPGSLPPQGSTVQPSPSQLAVKPRPDGEAPPLAMQQQQQLQNQYAGTQPRRQEPGERRWYDKLVDALVGEEGPESRYALICPHCYSHNGLVSPQELETIQYTCPHCKKFIPAKKPPAPRPSERQTPSPAPREGSPVTTQANIVVSPCELEEKVEPFRVSGEQDEKKVTEITSQ